MKSFYQFPLPSSLHLCSLSIHYKERGKEGRQAGWLAHTSAFDGWLAIRTLDFLVNLSLYVQRKVECIGISSSSGQNQADLWCWWNGTRWMKMQCHAWGRGRAAQRADIWGVAVAVIHEQEEGSRKKMAVLDSCICSFSCTGCPGCRQVRFSIRAEECAGRGYWCSFATALARRWGGGRPHHRVLCFWFADGSKYLAPLPLRH